MFPWQAGLACVVAEFALRIRRLCSRQLLYYFNNLMKFFFLSPTAFLLPVLGRCH
jgi:hypothetical protein